MEARGCGAWRAPSSRFGSFGRLGIGPALVEGHFSGKLPADAAHHHRWALRHAAASRYPRPRLMRSFRA